MQEPDNSVVRFLIICRKALRSSFERKNLERKKEREEKELVFNVKDNVQKKCRASAVIVEKERGLTAPKRMTDFTCLENTRNTNSLKDNNVGTDGAKALAKTLEGCRNLTNLKYVLFDPQNLHAFPRFFRSMKT